MAKFSDRDLRLELYHIQEKIAKTIFADVLNTEGMFFYGTTPPTKADIKTRLDLQRDFRTFNTLEGCRPFPPKEDD